MLKRQTVKNDVENMMEMYLFRSLMWGGFSSAAIFCLFNGGKILVPCLMYIMISLLFPLHILLLWKIHQLFHLNQV